MRGSKYIHQIERVDSFTLAGTGAIIDIEGFFTGLIYLKMEGLNTIGESKTTYIEDYADSERVRYYIPSSTSDYTNKNTTINLTVLFIGDEAQRQTALTNFYNELKVGVHRYWDSARKRRFYFILKDEIKVSDEKWHGGSPYIEVVFPLTNIHGKTEVVNAINA